ncbi:MAG: DUF2357 domain-containing protein [Chitinophagaceae bacterium]|nr:DUF2357 domain-containing protein [Chitinophagaceae bacterium]
MFLMEGTELEESEAPYQIVEGKFYDYKIDNGYFLKDSFGIVSGNDFDKSVGRIAPNIYVGTLTLDVCHTKTADKLGSVKLEVQSVKTEYRRDYRKMLSDITDECIELVFQHSSPITQVVETDYENDNKTWHQRFAFIKSVIDTEEFNEAVNKIISAPVTKWKATETYKDIRSVRRFNNKALYQIASAPNRIVLPDGHPLKSDKIKSIPAKIRVADKTETTDTPENRFVKHALQTFLFFVSDFKSKLKSENKIKLEAEKIESRLEQFLSHSVFKEISNPTSIILSSPVLQRKEGYREILRVWVMYNLAAQLAWKGGEDVYDIEKRNVAALYEYWLFFQLLKIVSKVFGIKPGKDLIVDTNDKLGLQLKQGEHFPVSGVCEKYNRKLKIQFSYNRTFAGSSEEYSYPESGSWTRRMRPDYTLSIWPAGINETEAEKQELITHIHFDAKYKIEKIIETLGDEEDLDKEKEEQSKGTYKRADLLKMHSYKDAIRRTGGAYILYPGKEQTKFSRMGFRELIPGLGAFQIRPSENGDTGSKELEKFFEDVVFHFVNRTSQREKTAYRIFDIHKSPPNADNEVREALPETYGINRNLLPDETFVLVGFSTKPAKFKWYEANGKYVFRMNEDKGSLELNTEVVNAKYLLLRKSGAEKASDIFEIKSKCPKVFSVSQLAKLNYPLSQNPKEYYLVIEIEKVTDKEFENVSWKFKELKKYKSIMEAGGSPRTKSGLPFTVSLTELMNALAKE